MGVHKRDVVLRCGRRAGGSGRLVAGALTLLPPLKRPSTQRDESLMYAGTDMETVQERRLYHEF
jgi:hypothetical protein